MDYTLRALIVLTFYLLFIAHLGLVYALFKGHYMIILGVPVLLILDVVVATHARTDW